MGFLGLGALWALCLALMSCADAADVGVTRAPLRPSPGASAAAPRFEPGDAVEHFDSTGGFFRVHFTRSGANAVPRTDKNGDGTPDYVATVADDFDAVLAFYVDQGYREPARDGSLSGDNGGDDRFDVYLLDFPTSADGEYRPDDACAAAVGCSGYMLLENDFDGRNYPSLDAAVRLVASHELFHAVQRAYVVEASGILNEGTATWASQAFDAKTGDLYEQAAAYLKQPERSLSQETQGTFDAFTYGSALFFQFLDEREGRDSLRELWEKLAAHSDDSDAAWLHALDEVLMGHGSSLADAFGDFVTWNLYTGKRADPDVAYADGDALPAITERTVQRGFSEDMVRVFPVSARYYALTSDASQQLSAAAVLAQADGLGLVLAREHGGRIDALQRAAPSGGALQGTLQLAAGDTLHVGLFNTRAEGSSLRPDLCLGSPSEVAACRAAHGDVAATPAAADGGRDKGGCSALPGRPRSPGAGLALGGLLALCVLRRYRRRS